MSWLRKLRQLVTRERQEEQKKTDELFRAQLAEALLRQDDLREAAAQMKKVRETAESDAPPPFRPAMSSKPL